MPINTTPIPSTKIAGVNPTPASPSLVERPVNSCKPTRLFIIVMLTCVALCGCAGTGSGSGGADALTSLAVWDLEALGPMNAAQQAMGEMLAVEIADRMGQSTAYEVVEREKLIHVLEEQRLGGSQLTDEDTRLRLGRLIGCRRMVFGAYQLLGGTMRLDLRIVDVSTGKVLKTADATAPAHNVASWLDTARTAAEDLIQP